MFRKVKSRIKWDDGDLRAKADRGLERREWGPGCTEGWLPSWSSL